jgi:ParB/RepB/Spo0J family partition protein
VAELEIRHLELRSLKISPLNVRTNMGDITELRDSIREEGVLQPLLVRPVDGHYEVVAGSRRLSAAQDLDLKAVPVIIRQLTDAQAVAASLTENLQRGDLTLEERAEGYKTLQRLQPFEFGSNKNLAKALGLSANRIENDLEAYEALLRLRSHGVKVATGPTLREEDRRRGEALPERHAGLLQEAFDAVHGLRQVDPDEATAKYVELAKEIAPLDQDDAKKVLDYFKMYPERPVLDIKSMALAKVDREVTFDLETARKLDELARTAGKSWDQVIDSLVDNRGLDLPSPSEQLPIPGGQPIGSDGSGILTVEPVGRPEPLELPEDSLSEQILRKTLWNIERAKLAGAKFAFYTIGYGQKSIDQFIDALEEEQISTLLDIRHDPVSMYKPDFSKDNLRRALEQVNIEYRHLPQLGVPRSIRSELVKSGDWDSLFRWYDKNAVPKLTNELVQEVRRAAKRPFAFMCVEVSPLNCHRHRLSIALEKHGLIGADL